MSIFASLLAAAALIPAETPGPVLLDGKCEDAVWQAAPATDLGLATSARWLQDRDYLYLCVALPPDSYGSMDLYFLDPADGIAVDLHVSGQRGERKQAAEGSWPDFVWENQRLWYGNIVVTPWTQAEGWGRAQPSQARELQIAKSRIVDSEGLARLMFVIRAIRSGEGWDGAVRFPENAVEERSETWAGVRMRPE